MRSVRHFSIALIVLLMVSASTLAQRVADPDNPTIRVLGRAFPDSVVLRWAPDSPAGWKFSNSYGYTIERLTILRDGKSLPEPDVKTLTSSPVLPYPLPQWEPLVEAEDYAAVAAQAIYGESFEVSGEYQSDVLSIINQAKELESRFSFALFAADMSPEVARASGLWFTDTEVKENEKYLYRVISAIPLEKYQIDTGTVYLGPQDYSDLPAPIDVEAEFGNQVVAVVWNKYYYTDIFTAYILERSDDEGKTFQRLSELPAVMAENPDNVDERLMYRVDSLPQNFKEYQFRVRGITPFGEIGPPSEVVKGIGFKMLDASPRITEVAIDSAIQEVEIKWTYPDDIKELAGFHVYLSNQAQGQYMRVNEDTLPTTLRKYRTQKALATSYFIVEAFGVDGGVGRSYPYMVQLADSTPPAPPVIAEAIADTSGLVTIRWQANQEEDLLGYRVYRANYGSEEMSQVTRQPVYDTTYQDTVEVKTLTKDIYYVLTAIDLRFNTSDFSEVLKVDRPDVLPPVEPVFSGYEALNEGIKLTWMPSSSDDVVRHLLYRRSEGNRQWALAYVADRADELHFYIDKEVAAATAYEYTLLAVDESGLESTPAKPVRVTSRKGAAPEGVTYLYAEADRENDQVQLAWQYESEGTIRFQIFRQEEEEGLRLFSTIERSDNRFEDDKVEAGKTYTYRVKILFPDGSESSFSPLVSVKY